MCMCVCVYVRMRICICVSAYVRIRCICDWRLFLSATVQMYMYCKSSCFVLCEAEYLQGYKNHFLNLCRVRWAPLSFLYGSPPWGVKLHETNPRFGLLKGSRNQHSLEIIVCKKKVHKMFAYPVKIFKSAKYIAGANNSLDSECTEESRTLWDRRCPRMSLVHLAVTTPLTLAGLTML